MSHVLLHSRDVRLKRRWHRFWFVALSWHSLTSLLPLHPHTFCLSPLLVFFPAASRVDTFLKGFRPLRLFRRHLSYSDAYHPVEYCCFSAGIISNFSCTRDVETGWAVRVNQKRRCWALGSHSGTRFVYYIYT